MTTRNKKKEKPKEKCVLFRFSDCTFKICKYKIFKVYVIDTENYKLLLRDINNDLNKSIIEECIIFLK